MKTIPVWTWPIYLAICGLIFQSCAAVAPIAESALQAVAPILWDALGDELKRKFGPATEPDVQTAECYQHDGSSLEDYPSEFPHRGWVICFMDRVKPAAE